jgi:indole-3-glycerol phosphate synthase
MNILLQIVEDKKLELTGLKEKIKPNETNNSKYKEFSFYTALSNKQQINLIAEIKKASPSKGIIKDNFNHLDIASEYMRSNVEAISVLTDKKYFMGDINYLSDISEIKTVPLLRKDFIIDEIQIYEAKLHGADAILLICEILDAYQIKEYTLLAKELKMDVLLELHSIKQLDKIDFEVNKIIGINNRNLENFEVNLNTTVEIKKHLPTDIIIVSESGIATTKDIEYLKHNNINAVLIGEYFMRKEDVYDAVKLFKEELKYEN